MTDLDDYHASLLDDEICREQYEIRYKIYRLGKEKGFKLGVRTPKTYYKESDVGCILYKDSDAINDMDVTFIKDIVDRGYGELEAHDGITAIVMRV